MFNKDSFPLIESRTLRGRQGINLSVHTCRSNSLFFFLYFLFFFFFSFYLSFSSLFSMLVFYSVVFLLRSYYPFFVLLVHGQGPLFYSVCHDQILLFQPLTTFVWSRCTCRPLLIHLCWLCHSYHQTKRTILFISLPWHPYLLWCRCSFSLSLMACTQWFPLTLTYSRRYVIPAEHFPQKSLSRNLKIGFFPLPTAIPYPLTYDPP